MKLRHTEDGSPSSFRGEGVSTEPGDEVDVDDEVGERLLEKRDFFERVDEDAEDSEDEDVDESEPEEATDLDTPEDEFEFDEENWFDGSWQRREGLVRQGAVDDALETIHDIETSENVREAVEERAPEIERDVELEDEDEETTIDSESFANDEDEE